MKTLIETYRGIEILFDTTYECFTYSFDGNNGMERNTFSSCKKAIDDYLKDNANFKPFKIRSTNEPYEVITVVGIRKDGRFVLETEKGKEQLSGYSENSYILYQESDDPIFEKLVNLQEQGRKLYEEKKSLLNGITTPRVNEIKKNYIQ